MTRADVMTKADINMVSCGVLDDFAYIGVQEWQEWINDSYTVDRIISVVCKLVRVKMRGVN